MDHVGIDFSRILMDFGIQKGRQNEAQIDSKNIEQMIDFSLAPFWEPTWDHVGAQDGPRAAQDGPRCPPRPAIRRSPFLSRMAKDAPGRPKTPQGSIFDRFLSIFGRFLIDFLQIFGRFLIDF